MKLYVVVRRYGTRAIYDGVLAQDEEDVYRVQNWEKTNKPPLEIREVEMKRGCFLSIMEA